MKADEVILYRPDLQSCTNAMGAAMDYALLSFPFTINRMALKRVEQRIVNIAKGKFAEELFRLFAADKGLEIDFDAGATPFYLPDRYDFSLKGYTCDLKNNYIYAPPDSITEASYLLLPALVPNRFDGDQWGKRLHDDGPENRKVSKAFIFTFIRLADKSGGAPLFGIRFTHEAVRHFTEWATKHSEAVPESEPFSPLGYLEWLQKKGFRPSVSFSALPQMAITGVATEAQWKQFADAGGGEDFGYFHYTGRWYEAGEKGRLTFCGGMLNTRIKNAVCPVGFLPSFAAWSGLC